MTEVRFKNPDAIVSTEWLKQHLDAPDVRVVDATCFLPIQGRNAISEYEEKHIPGAVFFDIDEIADMDSGLPHTMPSPEKFTARVRKLGLGDGNRIVVYDNGTFSAARVWFMFKFFGHDDVAVLDGGLPKWEADGYPTDDLPRPPRERHFSSHMQNMELRDMAAVKAALTNPDKQVVDARAAGRFQGEAPEPREGCESGHMPGSINLPFSRLYDEDDGTLLPADEVLDAFEAAGVDINKRVIASCGSGVTACNIILALHMLGQSDWALYDGSWAEWESKGGEIAKGA